MDLAKRTAGRPLSQAELEQRRDAARARWAAIGAGTAAAATTGAFAHHEIANARTAAAGTVRQERAVIGAASRTNALRAHRHASKVFLAEQALKPREDGGFVSAAIRTTASQHRRAAGDTRALFAEHAVDRVMGDGTPIRVVPEDAGISTLIDREGTLSQRLADLRANGRGARRVAVAGSEARPIKAHTRTIRGGRTASWEPGADEMFDHLRTQLGLPPAPNKSATAPEEPRVPPGPAPFDLDSSSANEPPRPWDPLEGYTPAQRLAIEKQKAKPSAFRDLYGDTEQFTKIIAKKLGIHLPTEKKHVSKQTLKNRLENHKITVEQILNPPDLEDGWTAQHESPDEIRAYLRRYDTLDRVAASVRSLPAAHRNGFLETCGLPKLTFPRPIRRVDVSAVAARAISNHSAKIAGYPDRATRASLSREMLGDVDRRATSWRRAEMGRAEARVAAARAMARQRALPAIKRLALLRNSRTRLGLVAGVAALAGVGTGLGTWLGARSKPSSGKIEKLAKGSLDSTPKSRDEPSRQLRRRNELAKAARPDSTPPVKSTPAEAALAQRLASLFGKWTDEAEDRIQQPTATTMHADMMDGLDHALQPLDQVVRESITAPIPVEAGEGGQQIAFSLRARSPDVTGYIDRYRQDRIVALADEQRDNIKAQLIDAATAGASPQEMATRIKHTIGLTPFQAGHVVNYQAELEQLNPAALKRQLRDRRYDKTIQRALDDGTVLPADYIQKAVDAYHRRYLAFRATTIARTEGVGAANNGQAAAAAAIEQQDPDYEIEKEWLAQDDERTRHDHALLNGQTVRGLDTPFICDSGDEIRWPHDPQAAARQVIKCRCTFTTRLVPKARSVPDSPART